MREIKYRGKVDGKWWYVTPDMFIKWKHFWAEVDPKTVGQYIGMPDAHNQEIYEGDIIQYEFDGGDNIERPPRIDEVKYVLGCFIPDIWRYQKPEVIGNIYENPELVNEE